MIDDNWLFRARLKSVNVKIKHNTLLIFLSLAFLVAPSSFADLPSQIIQISNDPELAKSVILVDKTTRLLQIWQNEAVTPNNSQNSDPKSLPIAQLKNKIEYLADIGKRKGPKTKENDHRTPVGIYFLLERKTQPEIPFDLYGSLAFTSDYPNVFDKREAKSGHGIWLHAIPDSVALTRGSRGCVVVRDSAIKEIESYIQLKETPIVIQEKVEFIKQDDHLKLQQKLLGHIESWRKSWESENVDEYLKYYDETFKNSNMNFKQWSAHKRKLKGTYNFIKVQLGSPMILMSNGQIVIRAVQNYESDLHQDKGIKTIHGFFSETNGFKIVREDWSPLKQ
jgi:murein L,D-transpeptidase YafK